MSTSGGGDFVSSSYLRMAGMKLLISLLPCIFVVAINGRRLECSRNITSLSKENLICLPSFTFNSS